MRDQGWSEGVLLAMREDGAFAPMSRKERWDAYKLVHMYPGRPSGVVDLFCKAWGADVFLWQVPMFKLVLALNVLFWWLLA